MTDTLKTGRNGEDIACTYLKCAGFEIKHRNLRMGHKETDIICENGEYVLFVEVKTRRKGASVGRYGSARDAVNAKKIALLSEAAREYMRKYGISKKPRLDVIEVYISNGGEPEIKHIKNILG